MTATEINQEACKQAAPQKEHEWLGKLVGEWTYEAECMMGPDQPPMKSGGSETIRSLGGLWIVGEGECKMPDGEPGQTLITLGYDPLTKRYVGTWVGSMMTHMWVYDGEVDASGKVLTLNAEGPSFTDPTKKAKYQDVIDWQNDNYRILRSRLLADNGEWMEFMTAHYKRKG